MRTANNRNLGLHGLLLDVLTGLPRLDGALCPGNWDLFEPQREDEPRSLVLERHTLAEQMCAACPALAACRDWASIEPDEGGVVAGRSTARFPGRPTDGRQDAEPAPLAEAG